MKAPIHQAKKDRKGRRPQDAGGKPPPAATESTSPRVHQLRSWDTLLNGGAKAQELESQESRMSSSFASRVQPFAGSEAPSEAPRATHGTGLPENLRAGLEGLSGRDLSAVRVHYDSPRPAQLQAHAFTQGSEIHVAPGQERHLPHEGWHAVQQMEGRVRATTQLHGTAINDSAGLEREADVMGLRAERAQPAQRQVAAPGSVAAESVPAGLVGGGPVQRQVDIADDPGDEAIAARLEGAFPNTLAEVDVEDLVDALGKLRASSVQFGTVRLDDPQQREMLLYYLQGFLAEPAGGEAVGRIGMQEAEQEAREEAWQRLRAQSPAPDRTYKLAFLGAGSSVAYYLNSMGPELDPAQTLVIGQIDPWADVAGDTRSRGPGYIGHTQQEIAHHGAEVPAYDEVLADRGGFAQQNAQQIARVPAENRVAAEIDSVTKDPRSGLYAIRTTGGETYYARKVVAGLGAGPHRVPPEVRAFRADQANEEAFGRVMDMDQFMRMVRLGPQGSAAGRERFGAGRTVIVVGPNAGIDVVEAAGRLGFDVEWFISARSEPALLPGAAQQQPSAQASAGRALVATDRNQTQVTRTGGDPPLEVTFYGRRKSAPAATNTLQSVRGDYYVYAIGQDVDAAGAAGSVLRNVRGDLEPIYDRNQALGDAPYKTVLGLQAPGTTRDSGLEVIGASAFSLGGGVQHNFLEQVYGESLDALYGLRDPKALLAGDSEWARLLLEIERQAERLFDLYRARFADPARDLDAATAASRQTLTEILEALSTTQFGPGDLAPSVREANAGLDMENLARYLRAKLSAPARRLQLLAEAIEYFSTQRQRETKEAVERDIMPIVPNSGRGVVSELMNPVRMQPTDNLLPPQLGPVRATVAAMNAALPAYLGQRSNFSSDDRNMLRVFIARRFPDLRDDDAQHVMGLILGHRRTGYHPFGYRQENAQGWPDWYRFFLEILAGWQARRQAGGGAPNQ